MLASFISAGVAAAFVFVVLAVIAILAQLLGPWFLPIVAVSAIVGLVILVLELAWVWVSRAPVE